MVSRPAPEVSERAVQLVGRNEVEGFGGAGLRNSGKGRNRAQNHGFGLKIMVLG